MGPPLCGMGNCRDYDKFLCNKYIYRGEEEFGIPITVEGRPYPLGGSPYGGNKRPKEEGRGYSGETTPDDSSTKLL